MVTRAECERNGCERVATRLLTWDLYTMTTKACDRHARWWREGSRMGVVETGLPRITR